MKAVCWMMNEPKQHVDPKPKGPVAGSRSAGAVLAILSGAVLLTAALLTPRAGGLGTHVQMGLSSCGYLADTGYPCPTCGMTTAMAAPRPTSPQGSPAEFGSSMPLVTEAIRLA